MADGDLCTADAVAQWLGLKGSADDALLDTLVTAISAAIVNTLNRPILQASYTETRNGTGKTSMMAINYPLISVTSVRVNGVAIPARPTFSAPGFVYDEDTIYLQGYCFDRGVQNVEIQDTAGYPNVPADLEQAVVEACAFLYRQKDRIGLATKGLAGETTSYLRDLPPELMRRIMNFARRVMPPR